MTDKITIPPEALENAAKTAYETQRRPDEPPWEDLPEGIKALWRHQQQTACLAMLEAWPGMEVKSCRRVPLYWRVPDEIILPLTKEPEV